MSEQGLKKRIEEEIEAAIDQVTPLNLSRGEYDIYRAWMRQGVMLGLGLGFEAGRNKYVHRPGTPLEISDWQYPTFEDLRKEIANE